MIQNYDKFSRWNAKVDKIYTLWKIVQQWLTQKMWSIGANICIFNNTLKKFIQKFIHMKKWKMMKKDS